MKRNVFKDLLTSISQVKEIKSTGKKYSRVEDIFEELEQWEKDHPIQNFFFTIKCYLESWFIINPRDLYRNIKWFIQRGIRGWADCDLWDFDNYISKTIQDALLALQKEKDTCPNALTKKEWEVILNKIIYSFHTANLISDGTYFYLPTYENKLCDYAKAKEDWKDIDFVVMDWDDCKRYEEGLELFNKYFHSLWS